MFNLRRSIGATIVSCLALVPLSCGPVISPSVSTTPGAIPEIAAPITAAIQIQYTSTDTRETTGRFEVRGLAVEQLAALTDDTIRADVFSVSVDGTTRLLGKSGVSDGVLWFQPRFPLQRGVRHTATLEQKSLPGGGATSQLEVLISHLDTQPTTITAIYPSGDTLPENVLRFYLQFSAPVKRGEVYRRVRLLTAENQPIDLPFLELAEELWDPTGTRLTLLIDPGRIKRGVKPREEIGPVFQVREHYTLEVDAAWPDLHDRPLKNPVRKSFTVSPPTATRIDVAAWKVNAPQSATGPLEVSFPVALDRGLLEHSLRVVDASGQPVTGRTEVTNAETQWRFVPTTPWLSGTYTLVVSVDLEDVAGNRPDRVFDTIGAAMNPEKSPVLRRSFSVPVMP